MVDAQHAGHHHEMAGWLAGVRVEWFPLAICVFFQVIELLDARARWGQFSQD